MLSILHKIELQRARQHFIDKQTLLQRKVHVKVHVKTQQQKQQQLQQQQHKSTHKKSCQTRESNSGTQSDTSETY